ncbi:GNAT family N-acetyltransferase [Leifsonia poae]|uniref:N-acetyltransferase n=1 Tax=Leifsonia poae TaxID=110933 RepID=A0A9W6H6J1_9MICO|nr:GNAT family N-acetyltransferase [Leifsonia poae]GLJ74839.1 N-acetyltransferase [Leifsonia poae]
MAGVLIRELHDDEVRAAAELRLLWDLENDVEPPISRDEFLDSAERWYRRNASSHHCTVVVRDGAIVGMAWLAVIARVPTPRSVDRLSADVQSVYVIPAERNAGIGGRLLAAVLDRAWSLGAERVTVHSSAEALTVYERAGFAPSERLLQRYRP